LRRAVKSIFLQTVFPAELIVVDDGSDIEVSKDVFHDAPAEINCTLLRNNIPKGANHARNSGVNIATCDWVMFLDDDDQFATDKVESVSAEIETRGEMLDVISHGATIVMPEFNLTYVANIGYDKEINLSRELLLRNVVGSTSFVTVKRSMLCSVGLFWEDLPALQDNELWLRLALSGARFSFIDKPLTIYEQSINTKSITKSDSQYRKAYQMLEQRYQSNYHNLNHKEIKRLHLYRCRSRVHRALLTRNYKVALFSQLKVVAAQPSLSNIIMIFLCLAGSKVVYKVRSLTE
jgi:glycosyltransferase involved in cell wall biosynthesis